MEEYVFIYIERFSFNDSKEKLKFFGHPKEGNVYKARKVGNMYEVPLKSRDGSLGVILDVRDEEDIDRGKWTCEIHEINEDNIDQFNISLKDLREIEREWSQSSSMELYDNNSEEKPMRKRQENNSNDENNQDIAKAFVGFSEYLNIIAEHDPDMLFTILEVVEEIKNDYEEDEENIKNSIVNYIQQLKNIRTNGTNNK